MHADDKRAGWYARIPLAGGIGGTVRVWLVADPSDSPAPRDKPDALPLILTLNRL